MQGARPPPAGVWGSAPRFSVIRRLNMAKQEKVKEYTEKDFTVETWDEYSGKYTEDGLWAKIKGNARSIGAGLIYKAFQLFYVTQNPACPMKVKAGIFGALGYLISPIDFLPDLIPALGYTDDLGAIGAALVMAQFYINDDVKWKAKKKMADLLGEDFVRKLD